MTVSKFRFGETSHCWSRNLPIYPDNLPHMSPCRVGVFRAHGTASRFNNTPTGVSRDLEHAAYNETHEYSSFVGGALLASCDMLWPEQGLKTSPRHQEFSRPCSHTVSAQAQSQGVPVQKAPTTAVAYDYTKCRLAGSNTMRWNPRARSPSSVTSL